MVPVPSRVSGLQSSDQVVFSTNHLVMHGCSHLPPMIPHVRQMVNFQHLTTSLKKCQVCAAVLVATAVLGAVLFAMRPCRSPVWRKRDRKFPKKQEITCQKQWHSIPFGFERNVCLGITQVCEFFISVQNASHSQHPGMCAGQV